LAWKQSAHTKAPPPVSLRTNPAGLGWLLRPPLVSE
jgi:hypothetical protein